MHGTPGTAASRRGRRDERGSALLVSVLLMALLAMIGLSSLETVTSDRRAAGFRSRASMALYAAEAGLANWIGDLGDAELPAAVGDLYDFEPVVAGADVGDAALYPYGQPAFAADANAAAGVAYLGKGAWCEGIGELGAGTTGFYHSLWDMRVQGQTPDGATARIQAAASRCHYYGN